MAKKSKLTVQERNMLQARAPSSTDVDMANTEIPLDQETREEFDASRDIAAMKTRLDQQREDIDENSELITIAGAKIFELEPVVNKLEKEFPIAKKRLHAYCKRTLDEFSDDLDDLARAGSDKWDRAHETGQLSESIDKVSDENTKLEEQIKKQEIALKKEKDANKQLKADVASIMRRLAAVEDVVHPDICKAAEKKFGEMDVSDTQ
ncbi:hypothetical protein FPHYL_8229 [Fusarium phyllophilum]|uniref:Uncharacterized protein n=1 Tax=Fusarium phyllophilum TaxID=47803 RepID=A0A8H5JK18_9HYPO|nr:hypothetical protein FPHYL_8229 [Fusarium phyllophilum]